MLNALAATATALYDAAAGVLVDPDDADIVGLPSDDEDGPEEVDDDDDARPPNAELPEDGADGQQVQPGAGGDATERGSAPSPPELPTSLETLRVIDLKIHLWWRNQSTSGNKPQLAARLKQAIDDGAALRTTAQAAEAGGCPHVAAAGNSVEWEADGRLREHELQGDTPLNGHAPIDAETAINLGLITKLYAENSLFCTYKYCYKAATNKVKKCGVGCKGKQKGRAKCKTICKHPRCNNRGFHGTCWSKAHRLLD